MLLFVSPVRRNEDGSITKSCYKDIDGGTYQTNESAVKYLYNRIGIIDKIFAIVSGKAREAVDILKPVDMLKNSTQQHIINQSSFSFFKERIQTCVRKDSDIIECEFDDSGVNGHMNNLNAIRQLTHKVMDVKKQWGQEDIIMHADLTGGFRSSNMMMIGAMRFLEYSNFKMGMVLYSNWEYDRKENWVDSGKKVYDFFDLVAGAEDFVNYGSAKELKKYYGRISDKSKGIENILAAMDNFSEQIQLCHTGKLFDDAIKDLKNSLAYFDDPDKVKANLNDSLFWTMIQTIREKYFPLLKSDSNTLDRIRWCVENSFIQQALTFYTNDVPEYLMEKKLFDVSSEYQVKFDDAYREYKKDKDNETENFFKVGIFMIEDSLVTIARDEFCTLIKKQFELRLHNKQVNYLTDTQINEIKEWEIKYKGKLRISNVDKIVDFYKMLPELCRFGQDKNELLKRSAFISKLILKYDKRNKDIAEDSSKRDLLWRLLEYCGKISSKDLAYASGIDIKSIDQYGLMFKNGVFVSNYNDRNVITILDDYAWIKNERNAANHAHDDLEQPSITEVSERLLGGIDLIKKTFMKEAENG